MRRRSGKLTPGVPSGVCRPRQGTSGPRFVHLGAEPPDVSLLGTAGSLPRSGGRGDLTGRARRAAGRLAAGLAACALVGACATAGSGVPAAPGGESAVPAGGVRPGAEPAGEGCPAAPSFRSGTLPDTVTVAAPGAVDPSDAPVPRTPAERLIFRQLYETLVVVDCRGRVRPALATSWSRRDGGRTWTFRLRDDVRFWDGTALTGGDVAWSWHRASEASRSGSPPAGSVASAPVFPDSVELPDQRTVRAFFGRPILDPGAFAEPALAVVRAAPGNWLVGTGAFRPDGTDDTTFVPTVGPGPVVVVLAGRPGPGGDGRDLLDAGVDILVTRDPATEDYAASLPGYTSLSLPWMTTYALALPRGPASPVGASTPGLEEGGVSERTVSGDLGALRSSLAMGAVRVEARPATATGWRAGTACGTAANAPPAEPAPVTAPSAPASHRLAYAAGDPVARGLADRLVALAASSMGPQGRAVADLLGGVGAGRWTTLALVPQVLTASARSAAESAYLLALRRSSEGPCAFGAALARALPWLPGGRGGLVPLVDTRPRLLLRRPLTTLPVDRDGVLRLAGILGGPTYRDGP